MRCPTPSLRRQDRCKCSVERLSAGRSWDSVTTCSWTDNPTYSGGNLLEASKGDSKYGYKLGYKLLPRAPKSAVHPPAVR